MTISSDDESQGTGYGHDSDDASMYSEEEEEASSRLELLLERIALFGDSPLALSASFVMLLVAVGTAFYVNQNELFETSVSTNKYNAKMGPLPKVDPPRIFNVTVTENSASARGGLVTDEIRSAYEKDGVVAVRGLIPEDLLKSLDRVSSEFVREQFLKDKQRRQKRTGTQFHMVRMGAAFLDPSPATDNPGSEEIQKGGLSAFRDVALFSPVPKFAAELMGLSAENNETLRMLRDIFLTKDEEEYVCGWHVDDLGFWPATAASPGVNAWIAVDDMPTASGGGFALAVGSHSTPWRHDAHRAIGSTLTFPSEGFQSAADMFENRTGAGTCNLQSEAPHIHKRMEETKRVYEIQRGDVLFHERWLFHRTVPFDRDAVAKHNEEEGALIYRRYSVRYGPGSSEIPRGYGTELSVLWSSDNGGRTADEVAALDGPWYPRCWPEPSKEEMRQLRNLVVEKVPVAEERRIEIQKEMQPYLKKHAKAQYRGGDTEY